MPYPSVAFLRRGPALFCKANTNRIIENSNKISKITAQKLFSETRLTINNVFEEDIRLMPGKKANGAM
jgi:hypothetical protein